MKNKDETFKLTGRFMVAISDLYFVVPTDDRTFGAFIDALYFFIAESANADKPRFLRENKGELEREECNVVWITKRLRNNYRHDPDHGKDIPKKFTSLNEDMASFGLRFLPRTADEYRHVHHVMLRQTAEFLRRLRDRI